MVRVHDSAFGAIEPHPGPDRAHHHGTEWPRTRFAHFRHNLNKPWVPSMYGGTNDITAIAETMLRGRDSSPADRPVHIRWGQWDGHMISTIAPSRPLQLVAVVDPSLIATDRTTYPTTVAAAAALHAAHPDADGLIWTSRQHPDSEACLLWVDEPATGLRVTRTDLTVLRQPIPVTGEEGQQRVLTAAEHLDLMVVARSGP